MHDFVSKYLHMIKSSILKYMFMEVHVIPIKKLTLSINVLCCCHAGMTRVLMTSMASARKRDLTTKMQDLDVNRLLVHVSFTGNMIIVLEDRTITTN